LSEILSVVVRIKGVVISQADLEARLAVRLERYEAVSGYAQLAVGESWDDVDKALQLYGETVKALREEGALNSAFLNVAFSFDDNLAGITRRIPASILTLAGRSGIDIDVSVYKTAD
jgi:hypothetical protein